MSSSWTQPAVTCGPQQTFSSFWVGLDGDGTQSVEQTGTEADCSGGAAAYQGWWEMFPAAPVFYNSAGQAGRRHERLGHRQRRRRVHADPERPDRELDPDHPADLADGFQLGSAEVIAEAPSSQNGVLPLSNFGTVNFTNALADNAPIGNAAADSLTMVAANGTIEATPSALTDGDAFAVTFGGGGRHHRRRIARPHWEHCSQWQHAAHHRGQPGPQPHGDGAPPSPPLVLVAG